MANPSCPYGCGTLKLETHNYAGITGYGKTRYKRGDFYVCHGCKKHWLRGSVISRNTARDGAKPRRMEKT